MHCNGRDQDILLLHHGELAPWHALLVRYHLRSCVHCQEHFTEMARVSGLVAGAIRQDAGLPAFAMRGDPYAVPRLRPATPSHFLSRRATYRPAFVIAVSTIAAVIAASAYAYKAVALAPTPDVGFETASLFPAQRSFAPGRARDANGNPTIFPYSTPDLHGGCEKGSN